MSLPIDITDLLHGHAVEWERLEFKRSWNPADVLHTLCAFANDFHNLGGGYVVIGVAEENGRPVLPPEGLKPQEADRIQKDLLNLGNSSIRPPYHPLTAPYEIDGKLVLVLWAPGGRTRPYRARSSLAKDKADDYAWFIRKNSNTVKARGADETELMGLAAAVPLDDRENIFAKVDDLSRDLVVEYLREVKSDLAKEAKKLLLAELGRRMGIVGGTREAPYPINAGLLFFHPEPWRFFPATQIDVVWFPEGRSGDRFTEKEFRGPLHKMLRDALSYIKTTFISTTVVKHADRAEADRVVNYPFEAIEEALVNAVYHRGYDVREPVEVSITREELTVVSYPGPDRSVKQEELAAGRAMSRRYRNRRIGEFLKELDLTEGRGTGVPKILRAMRENGSPPPVFKFDEDHSYFATILPVHPAALAAAADSRGTITAQVTVQVTAQVAGLIEHLDGELTRGALQKALGLTHREHFRRAYLLPALEAGLVEMTQPNKPNSRSQRYRLTAAGKEQRAKRGTKP
jgi:ATP-dependent DNA helicase RecG